MSAELVGRRREDVGAGELPPDVKRGDYWRSGETWYGAAPIGDGIGFGVGNLAGHTVTEHDDGTITVEPSILMSGAYGRHYHGYLRGGVWTADLG